MARRLVTQRHSSSFLIITLHGTVERHTLLDCLQELTFISFERNDVEATPDDVKSQVGF